jgi:hypothetical protein
MCCIAGATCMHRCCATCTCTTAGRRMHVYRKQPLTTCRACCGCCQSSCASVLLRMLSKLCMQPQSSPTAVGREPTSWRLPAVVSDRCGHGRYTRMHMLEVRHTGHLFSVLQHPGQQHRCPQDTNTMLLGADRHTTHTPADSDSPLLSSSAAAAAALVPAAAREPRAAICSAVRRAWRSR